MILHCVITTVHFDLDFCFPQLQWKIQFFIVLLLILLKLLSLAWSLVAVLFLPTIKWNRNQRFIYPPGLCDLSQIHFHHNHSSGWSRTQRIWKKTLQATELSSIYCIYFILHLFIYAFLFLLWPFFLCLVLPPPLAPLPPPPPMNTEMNLRSIILNQYLWVCVWDVKIKN